MKVLITLATLFAAAMAAAPEPPVGWRPSGRLLLLPARLENTPAEEPQDTQPEGDQSARLLDSGEYHVLLPDGRLQMVKYTTAALQEQDLSSKNQESFQQQQSQQDQSKTSQYRYLFPAESSNFQKPQQSQQEQSKTSQYRYLFPAKSSNFQKPQQFKQAEPAPAFYHVEYAQFPLPGSRFAQTKLQLKEDYDKEEAKKSEDQKEASAEGFEANVQFREVKPISAPIYAYNPTPLVRILRNTE